MRRKQLSKRRLKARFMRDRSIALEDIYNRRLVEFIQAHGYESDDRRMMIRRYFEPIRIVLDEYSTQNLRAAFFGEANDDEGF